MSTKFNLIDNQSFIEIAYKFTNLLTESEFLLSLEVE